MKALTLIFVSMFLILCVGCSTTEPIIKVEFIRETPPESLLRECQAPQYIPVAINGDIISNWNLADEAYALCAARVKRIQEWHAGKRL